MARLSDQFDQLCQDRHTTGAAEYGAFTFLSNDVTRMLAEELADTANYCRYQFIKIMMLQDILVQEAGQAATDMGMGTFNGAGEVGWHGHSSGNFS